MTTGEVKELTSGAVLENHYAAPIDRERFECLVEVLAEHGLDEIEEFYGETREEWRPPITNPATVREIVEEVIQQVNRHRQLTPGENILRPQFFSTDFLSDDVAWRGRTWDRLGSLGCVLIVDAISVFHPLLRQKLLLSEFGSNPRVSIVVLSPVGSNTLTINELLEREVAPQIQRAFDRFAVHLDVLCEFGAGDVRALRRWLFRALPETARMIQGSRANPQQRERMRERLGQPAGIDRVIFGRGG